MRTTNPLIARPLSGFLNVHGIEFRLFWVKAFPLTILLMSHKAAVATYFNVFSYDANWAENWTHYLPQRRVDAPQVMPQTRVIWPYIRISVIEKMRYWKRYLFFWDLRTDKFDLYFSFKNTRDSLTFFIKTFTLKAKAILCLI